MMNKGVEILIERMRTNPEDFSPDGKFGDTARRIREGITGEDAGKMPWFTRHLLTDTEWEALKTAFIEMSRDAFTQKVMKNLLKEKEELKAVAYEYQGYSSPNLGLSTGTTGASIVANSNAGTLTLNANGKSTTLTTEMVEYLEDRMKERKNDGAF